MLDFLNVLKVLDWECLDVLIFGILRIVMEFNPRGGISSKLVIDSDWKTRGGDEKFKDWIGQEDKW